MRKTLLLLPMVFLPVGTVGAGEWAVYPSGDLSGVTDGANIQAAIDSAAPGDTIVLKAGTFHLGAPDENATVPLPEGDSMTFWGDFLDFEHPIQFLVVDKSLTIQGERADDDGGPPATILGVGRKCSDHQWEADSFAFIVGAPDVEFRDLEFNGSFDTVHFLGGNKHS